MLKPKAVEVIEAHKRYGGFHALTNASIDVFKGEVLCIIGPSGSGKSTLLRSINHLEKLDGGVVKVNGEIIGYRLSGNDLHPLSEREIAKQRARIGMVFQQFNLFAHMTVMENLIEGPVGIHGLSVADAKKKALGLLQKVGLESKESSYPSQLSGGQQQRIAIARALAMDPVVMLFDEPTSALDPELVGEVLQAMHELAKSGLTMIIVTHELAFARDVADRIVFMDHGMIVEVNGASELLNNPRHPRTKEFLSAIRPNSERNAL